MAIQSIQRALDVLELFSKSRLSYKLTEIANTLNLNIATVHGIVSTLEQHHFLRQDSRTREYMLGTKPYELGVFFASKLDINVHAAGHVHRLAYRTKSNVRVGIWDNNTVLRTLFAYHESTAHTFQNNNPRIIPYCTALGKAILAYMSEDHLNAYLDTEKLVKHTKFTLTSKKAIQKDLIKTRERGYAINRSALSLGSAAIAAPIWGAGKVLEGGLSITLKDDTFFTENLEALSKDLLYTATEISQSLGYAPGEPY